MFCLLQGDGPSEGEVPPWRQALFRHINVLFASALSVAKNTFIVTWSPVSQTLPPVVSPLIAEFAPDRWLQSSLSVRVLLHFLQTRVSLSHTSFLRTAVTSHTLLTSRDRDVLKRHLRKCKRRAQAIGASIGVVDAPQSSRRRACDRCARQKHACNLANPCQRCIGRNEPCTYRRAQGIVSNTSDEALAAIISRPARRLGPSEDDAIESTLWTGTFASTDLVPVLTPHETSWDIYWPPDIPQLSPCTGVTAGGQGWEACAPPDSANAGFTLSPSPWQDLLEDQTSPIRHDSPPLRPNDTMGTFSFAFLANFTSTTGFVNSFDCGTLDERKLVVRGCSTTDVNKFCIDTSGGEEDYPACFHSGESTCEDSNAVVEALPHIWGIILQEKVLIEGARTKYQRNPQMTPLYTTNWMQPPSEGHCVDPIACTTGNGVTKNLKFDIQSGHRLLSNPLTLMTHEIISRIKEVVSLKPRNSIITLTWSPLLEEICLQFFSPPNLSKYLELYWACWHPNWPVVHKPTFSPASAHPVLVAAMALVGMIFHIMSCLDHTDLCRSLCIA